MKARIGAVAVVVLVLGAWAASLASARSGVFTVTYSGAGTLTSRLKSVTSPQCGEVTEVRNETTHFSWVTHYELPVLIFTQHGVEGVSAKAEAQASSLASNDSKVTLSDTGCKGALANCTGESDPQPNHEAEAAVADARKRGSTRVQVGAVGGFAGFTGKGFSGPWGFLNGSCAIEFNDATLLLPEFNVPRQLEANFPVKVATFKSLRVGHYFKVRIHAGHYAPAHHASCFAAGGCLKDDFSWHGVVEVKRTG